MRCRLFVKYFHPVKASHFVNSGFQVLVEKMGLPEASRGVGSSKTDLLGKAKLWT